MVNNNSATNDFDMSLLAIPHDIDNLQEQHSPHAHMYGI